MGSSLIAARVAGSASLEVCWSDGDGEPSGVHEFGEPSFSSTMLVSGDGLGSEAFVGKVDVVPFKLSPGLFSNLVLYEGVIPIDEGGNVGALCLWMRVTGSEKEVSFLHCVPSLLPLWVLRVIPIGW